MKDYTFAIAISFVLAAIISIAWVFMEDNYQKNKDEYDKSDWL
jgi:hypothetical protein